MKNHSRNKARAARNGKADPPREREDFAGPVDSPRSGAPERDRECAAGHAFTTDQGVPIPHTDDSLKAGPRGPSLIEDFHLREKLTRFDHERIPERVVHARGSGAHGYFQVYRSLEKLTAARFLCDPGLKTPVFVRFSTVVGSRGSADTVRDARGFATKFYTPEGNFDLVGNNIPVFFIQDGIKFPDLVHAIKPEPHHEMPQASSAHDTFWDFISLTPETIHMVMWVMSDRGIPRSYRMMEGFGVHTFRLVNAEGRSVFCKFHWKPILGAHSLVWDEAQKIAGKDPDYHRKDLWEAIEAGDYPEYELGLQIVEGDGEDLGFDLLDPTKIIPEEVVPVQRVGRLVLNRNPDNFFAETEQVAFCIGNLVPGIDVTNDPLLQARMFSYMDTQLLRLGGPNFTELPINRPLAPVHNHHQDGLKRHSIPTARALYHPNSIAGGMPALAPNGFTHHSESLHGPKTRDRARSFGDHFTQARMFLHSQSPAERAHLVEACRFELGKVERLGIRQRVIALFEQVEPDFAREVAEGVGVASNARRDGARSRKPARSPALSLERQPRESIRTRRVAALAVTGVDGDAFAAVCGILQGLGAAVEVVSTALGQIRAHDGRPVDVDRTFLTTSSVLYDAVWVPDSAQPETGLDQIPEAVEFVREAFRHAKPVGANGSGVAFVEASLLDPADANGGAESRQRGVVLQREGDAREFAKAFAEAIAAHRHFDREPRPARGMQPSRR
jgi:catalase